ncbi:hypothetical protein F5Y19DRAFT_472490 [Xylariaceae sp. FL1651]|nr:hypothetical protein F5Y19DRAFT_472490 [Xylariaceae sp. FL1651]
MADHAPGYEQTDEELQCYNCGMKGHLFFACPEDTRRVPAGLEASRKRQNSGNESIAPRKRSKGPIVTHYPPPPGLPNGSPPPTTYSPRPGYEGYYPGQPPGTPATHPYHQPAYPERYEQYPPATGRGPPQGFPYGGPRNVHEHQFHGPPRELPPGVPYGSPRYDRYDQYHSGPSPLPPPGRPYSAYTDRYDEPPPGIPRGSHFASADRPPYQTHYEQYPPTLGVDNYRQGPPQQYPPAPHPNAYRDLSHNGHDDVPAPRSYPPGPGSPPPGPYHYQSLQYSPSVPPPYHTYQETQYSDRPAYEPQRREGYRHYGERRYIESQQNRDRHDRRARYDSPKSRVRSERRFQDRPPRVASPVRPISQALPKVEPTLPAVNKCLQGPDHVSPADHKSTEKESDEEFSWEEEMIFMELPAKITKDLIREPLPAEWTDDPIMPPKYDKETITSKYISSSNVDDFALSVRETKAWQVIQHHPAFLPPTGVRVEKLWDYERALNPGTIPSKQNRHISNKQRGKNWGPKTRGSRQNRYPQYHGHHQSPAIGQSSYTQLGIRKRSWDQTNYRDAERPQEEGEIYEKKPKVSSPEPGEVFEIDDQEPVPETKGTSPSPTGEYRQGHQDLQARVISTLQDPQTALPDISTQDCIRRSPLPILSPAPPPSRPPGYHSRPSSRRSSRSGPSRPSSRRSSRSNPSRPSSRRSSMGSPLTPNERELLGMRPYSSGSDTGQDSPTTQFNDISSRFRQRPPKVDAAYQ